ncbi:DUF3037 domain-containing protein [Leeia sp. TBRC 13508]|uniref:DUF3037 domain-containing protein n=1 Tax=Leeia speluncae TaxID=2884804 RepID=A0ABS8D8C1_9NEIS|nr:DUF3037 domain-containing protein [Leeia speluncae]MCB6184258.1 DUF3037 domain-containing protein [Leeia speluncae]
MMNFACRYSIIRFMPYPETGEFANIGILLACPKTGYIDFQIDDRRYARITDFFHELGKDSYLSSVKRFKAELQNYTQQEYENPDVVRNLFDHITLAKETILQFSESRVLLTNDPKKALRELYSYYVMRSFIQKEQHTEQLERRVSAMIKALALPRPFRSESIGPDEFKVNFPLALHDEDGHLVKLIKPIYLGHPEPSKIYEHGDKWTTKVRRLKRFSALPDQVLFAAEKPANSEKCITAFNEIRDELLDCGITFLLANQQAEIQNFATS